jgi:hypothetical protein
VTCWAVLGPCHADVDVILTFDPRDRAAMEEFLQEYKINVLERRPLPSDFDTFGW